MCTYFFVLGKSCKKKTRSRNKSSEPADNDFSVRKKRSTSEDYKIRAGNKRGEIRIIERKNSAKKTTVPRSYKNLWRIEIIY